MLQSDMDFAGALSESLLRTALFAETHAIKGVLAADRLVQRCAALPPSFFADALALFQMLPSPRVAGPLRQHVAWDQPIDDRKMEGAILRAVFPLAYEASALWVERRGLPDLVARYRRAAVARLGHLGHSFTIWCSFHEVLPRLASRADELVCAERFVELVAAQLSHNDPTRPGPDVEPLDSPPTDDAETLDLALAHPGFFAHTLITLAYVHRHRGLLSAAEQRWAMARVRTMTFTGRAAGASIATRAPAGVATDREVEDAIVGLARFGPPEVHRLTLADAAFDLAAVATPRQKAHLVAALDAVRNLDRT
jgi:hypothetical protein